MSKNNPSSCLSQDEIGDQKIEDDPDTEFFATFAEECHEYLSASNFAYSSIEEDLKNV